MRIAPPRRCRVAGWLPCSCPPSVGHIRHGPQRPDGPIDRRAGRRERIHAGQPPFLVLGGLPGRLGRRPGGRRPRRHRSGGHRRRPSVVAARPRCDRAGPRPPTDTLQGPGRHARGRSSRVVARGRSRRRAAHRHRLWRCNSRTDDLAASGPVRRPGARDRRDRLRRTRRRHRARRRLAVRRRQHRGPDADRRRLVAKPRDQRRRRPWLVLRLRFGWDRPMGTPSDGPATPGI